MAAASYRSDLSRDAGSRALELQMQKKKKEGQFCLFLVLTSVTGRGRAGEMLAVISPGARAVAQHCIGWI